MSNSTRAKSISFAMALLSIVLINTSSSFFFYNVSSSHVFIMALLFACSVALYSSTLMAREASTMPHRYAENTLMKNLMATNYFPSLRSWVTKTKELTLIAWLLCASIFLLAATSDVWVGSASTLSMIKEFSLSRPTVSALVFITTFCITLQIYFGRVLFMVKHKINELA